MSEGNEPIRPSPGPAAQGPTSGTAQGGPPAIVTVGLTRRFGTFTAVDGLDLTVPAGSIFGLLGPNGAGKSTTIKMLTTLLPPTGGTARVAGFDVVREPTQVRRRIGYVPQLVSADGSLTAYENLMVMAKIYGVPRAERRDRVLQVLEFMGLRDVAHTLVSRFSGGMVRRLEIAQSMLHRPAVLFLDEPTVGLDPVARRSVWEHVQRLRRDYGTTILVTTHYMDEADQLCDWVAIMHRGRVVTVGTPAELKAAVGPDATLDDVFAHFTGSSIAEGGSYRDAVRARRVARRLG
nr:MAG: multidrug ABC transporter ATP-binding protein [Bacillota bacterium]